MEEMTTREILPNPQIKIRQEKSLEFIAQTIKNYENVGDETFYFEL